MEAPQLLYIGTTMSEVRKVLSASCEHPTSSAGAYVFSPLAPQAVLRSRGIGLRKRCTVTMNYMYWYSTRSERFQLELSPGRLDPDRRLACAHHCAIAIN